jgi:pimeloyl-ACP methyl ester carboxylesterase
MPTRNINGAVIHYADKGDGPALALVHGFPLDHTVWTDQIDALAGKYRVIAPDLRGFGASGNDRAFSILDLADDLHTLLQSLGALPCVLAGLSMGGYVSLAFCKKYPADLRGLVLIDTKADGDDAQARIKRDEMAEVARESGAEAVAEMMFPRMLAPANQSGAVAERLRRVMLNCPSATIAHACLAMRDRDDFVNDLPSIPVPVMLIYGEQDAITPPQKGRDIAARVSRSQLVVIPGAGHMTPIETPRAVSEALEGFMRGVGDGQ